MKASVVKISELYTTLSRAYVVPAYQRPFSWSPERAKELLESIYNDALDDESDLDATSFGTVLFHPLHLQRSNPFGNNSPQSNAVTALWEVVDGQQRLTTLALMGHCLQMRWQQLVKDGLSYRPSMDLPQFYCTYQRHGGKPLPLLIRDGDNFDSGYKSELALILDGFNDGKHSVLRTGSNLVGMHIEINSWVQERLNGENFSIFCDYLLNKCNVIQVEAYEENQAFTLFETLNSTSEPLTALEVFKAKSVRQLRDEGASFTEVERYLDYRVSKRDDVTKKSNDIVFIHAQVYSGRRLKKIHFVPLKKYLDTQISNEGVEGLESIACFLRTIWESQDAAHSWLDRETVNLLRFLRAAKHEAPIPLLARAYIENPELLPEVVRAVSAFFALWRCGATTRNLPDAYRVLFALDATAAVGASSTSIAVSTGVEVSASNIRSHLLRRLQQQMSAGLRGSPAERSEALKISWVNNFQNNLNYKDLAVVCRLFILMDIEAEFKCNLSPDDPWTRLDDIEHILPSSASDDDGDLGCIHLLGNLTFLPPAINRSIKDMDWSKKRQVYRALSEGRVGSTFVFTDGTPFPAAVTEYLRNLEAPSLAHLKPLAEHEVWTRDQIRTRTSEILRRVSVLLFDKYLI